VQDILVALVALILQELNTFMLLGVMRNACTDQERLQARNVGVKVIVHQPALSA